MASEERLPLSGPGVVALEHAVSAPLRGRHLGDLGANVIKAERPDGGDFSRHCDSVVKGESAYFAWLNAGKRSLAAVPPFGRPATGSVRVPGLGDDTEETLAELALASTGDAP